MLCIVCCVLYAVYEILLTQTKPWVVMSILVAIESILVNALRREQVLPSIMSSTAIDWLTSRSRCGWVCIVFVNSERASSCQSQQYSSMIREEPLPLRTRLSTTEARAIFHRRTSVARSSEGASEPLTVGIDRLPDLLLFILNR